MYNYIITFGEKKRKSQKINIKKLLTYCPSSAIIKPQKQINHRHMKGVTHMGTEAERQDTRKAMAFDLCNITDENAALDEKAKEEVKKMIKAYVNTANQK